MLRTKTKPVLRREEETQEQYCDRRWSELSRCPNPDMSELEDYEKCPAAAVALWYKQANLRTRHEPPACVTEDVIMLHRMLRTKTKPAFVNC